MDSASMAGVIERIKKYISLLDNDAVTTDLGFHIAQYMDLMASTKADSKKYNVTIKIIDPKNGFSGISVYPELSEMTPILRKFADRDYGKLYPEWRKICRIIIEIDKNMLDNTIINFTPDEIWELIKAQINYTMDGMPLHVVFDEFMTTNSYLTMIQTANVARLVSIFYTIPLITAMTGIQSYVSLNSELANPTAPTVATNCNYTSENGCGEEIPTPQINREVYYNAINKIIARYGTTVLRNNDVRRHEVHVDVNWCNINIKDIMRRRGQLQAELINRAARATSYSMRFAILNICAQCGYGLKDRYTNKLIAMESVIDNIDKGEYTLQAAMESYTFTGSNPRTAAIEIASAEAYGTSEDVALEAFIKKKKRAVLPSDYAIDDIWIEIDKIENHYDRAYVLDLIYHKIDQLNYFEDSCRQNGEYHKYDAKIKSTKESLQKLRRAVLDKKIAPKTYGIYVKCPPGYEG